MRQIATLPCAFDQLPTPIGVITLAAGPLGITGIHFPDRPDRHAPASPPPCASSARHDPEIFAELRDQLAAYFDGTLRTFNFQIPESVGTPFQRTVWHELQRIPFGQTISYVELARRVGNPKASRAVGAANGRNPFPIVVPCHRVIGASGNLVGFGGGMACKRWLIQHEARVAGLQPKVCANSPVEAPLFVA